MPSKGAVSVLANQVVPWVYFHTKASLGVLLTQSFPKDGAVTIGDTANDVGSIGTSI